MIHLINEPSTHHTKVEKSRVDQTKIKSCKLQELHKKSLITNYKIYAPPQKKFFGNIFTPYIQMLN